MIEIIVGGLYCLLAVYAFYKVGMDVQISKAQTKRQKVWRILLLILMVFGLLVSVILLAEVIFFVVAPNTFDIL